MPVPVRRVLAFFPARESVPLALVSVLARELVRPVLGSVLAPESVRRALVRGAVALGGRKGGRKGVRGGGSDSPRP